jgi:hypothetical protein
MPLLSDNPLWEEFGERALLFAPAGGADFGECQVTVETVGENASADDWRREWRATAEWLESIAQQCAAKGHRTSPGPGAGPRRHPDAPGLGERGDPGPRPHPDRAPGTELGRLPHARAAAFEHRLVALVADPGQWDIRDALPSRLPLTDAQKGAFPDVDPRALDPMVEWLREQADPPKRSGSFSAPCGSAAPPTSSTGRSTGSVTRSRPWRPTSRAPPC